MRYLRPDSVYVVTSGTFALASAIMFTTYALYYVEMIGLGPLELVLIGTILEGTVFLFEIPTGVVADVYSRRLSVIIGTGMIGAGFLLKGSVPMWGGVLSSLFLALALGEFVRGVGETFMSGAHQAWLADEVGTGRMGSLLLKAAKVRRICGLIGIPISAWLANLQLNLPYLVGGGMLVLLCLFQILAMPETGFKARATSEESPWRQMRSTFQAGVTAVRGRPLLVALLVVSLIAGAASEGFDRLGEAHLLTTLSLGEVGKLSAATWFGLLAAAGAVLGLIAAHIAEKRVELSDSRQASSLLLTTAALRVLCILGFAFAPNLWWALVPYLALSAISAIYEPAYDTWVNQQVDSRVRATVLSVLGQSNALGQAGGGPVVGWIGSRFGLRAALGMAALLLTPALGVFGWAKKQPAAESHPEMMEPGVE